MVKLNCLAKDLENAVAVYQATNGNTLVGLTTKSFASDAEAIATMNAWSAQIDHNISIGLGGGDPQQSYMVTRVAAQVFANHINQVFSQTAATRAVSKNEKAIVNALISPSGTPGMVIISTGPISSKSKKPAVVDVDTACQMIQEMGGNALKFFNMKNMQSDQELIAVAKACAKYDLILEMTGGINSENIEHYVKIAHTNQVAKIIPHIYSAIIDQKTGLTKVAEVKKIWAILKRYY